MRILAFLRRCSAATASWHVVVIRWWWQRCSGAAFGARYPGALGLLPALSLGTRRGAGRCRNGCLRAWATTASTRGRFSCFALPWPVRCSDLLSRPGLSREGAGEGALYRSRAGSPWPLPVDREVRRQGCQGTVWRAGPLRGRPLSGLLCRPLPAPGWLAATQPFAQRAVSRIRREGQRSRMACLRRPCCPMQSRGCRNRGRSAAWRSLWTRPHSRARSVRSPSPSEGAPDTARAWSCGVCRGDAIVEDFLAHRPLRSWCTCAAGERPARAARRQLSSSQDVWGKRCAAPPIGWRRGRSRSGTPAASRGTWGPAAVGAAGWHQPELRDAVCADGPHRPSPGPAARDQRRPAAAASGSRPGR